VRAESDENDVNTSGDCRRRSRVRTHGIPRALGSARQTTNQENMNMSNATQLSFESIDSNLLAGVTGGEGQGQPQQQPNFLERWGQNMQTGGEYAMAAGAVGTAVPGLGETGIPEGVAAGGGASWLIGKGAQAVGGLFH
jgi:hypothetical protein